MLNKILSFLGFDRTIVYVLISKGWNVLSGVVILLFISKFLSVTEQGYYFTFSSIIAMQILFELGFGTVIIQFISHEAPKLKLTRIKHAVSVSGDNISLQRFYSIIRLVIKWYWFVGVLMFFIVLPAGIVFFSSDLATITNINVFILKEKTWLFPWLVLVICAILSLSVTPILSIAEGCGYVTEVAKVRLVQSIVNAVITALALLSGHGLYAVASSLLALFIVGGVWGYRRFSLILFSSFICKEKIDKPFSWRTEMFPVQWRIAISWLSGFFIFQLFNPIAFKVYGPEFAGKLGMTINICNMLLNLSLSWIMTKVPRFGNLVAEKNKLQLSMLYTKTFYQSLLFLCFCVVVSSCFIFIFNYLNLFFMNRLLPPLLFALMLFTTVGNHIVACQATYIRSHKIELYMPHAIFTALLIIILLSLTRVMPPIGLVVGYCFVVWFFCVPYSVYIFKKFNKGVFVE